MSLTRDLAGFPIGRAVLVLAVTSRAGQAGAQAATSAARAASERIEALDEKKVEQFVALAEPTMKVRFKAVDPAQFKAAVAGTENLYRVMAASRNPGVTRLRELDGALSAMEIVARGFTGRREVDRQTLDLVRLTERRLMLTYFDGAGTEYAKMDIAVHQSGYVLDDRMHRMADAIDSGSAARDWTPGGKDRAKAALAQGRALSLELAPIGNASARQVQALSESVDRLVRRITTGPAALPEERALLLIEGIVTDLKQQQVAYSRQMEAPIEVMVRTKRDGQEQPGHVIRYELRSDYELSELQNQRFDALSSPSSQALGPYRYYFWTENAGGRTSAPQIINLGEPLQAHREVDLLLSPQP